MVYETEAVVPAEIGQESARILGYSSENDSLQAMDLDLVEEKSNRAAVRLLEDKQHLPYALDKDRKGPHSRIAHDDSAVIGQLEMDAMSLKVRVNMKRQEYDMSSSRSNLAKEIGDHDDEVSEEEALDVPELDDSDDEDTIVHEGICNCFLEVAS